MAKLTLGGKTYEISDMSFEAVERAWPYITAAISAQDPIAGVSAGLAVIAAAFIEEEWFKPEDFQLEPVAGFTNPQDQLFDLLRARLKRMLKAKDIGEVRLAVIETVREAGLLPKSGEDQLSPEQVEAMKLLGMETPTPLSQNSATTGLKEEAGTP